MAAPESTLYPWHRQVPRLGSPEEFASLRALLETSQYSNEGLCRRLGVAELDNFSAPPDDMIERPIGNALDALARLFFHAVFAREAEVGRVLGGGNFAVLESLGLIARDPAHPGMIFGASAILPAAGLLTVCDRGNHAPDGSRCEFPPDVVYPPIFDTTRRFLESLPETPCGTMLDLGTGTGIAAMLGTRFARHVWATDITARSVLFAEFNRRLYALENMTVAEGDLFSAVEGLTFDRVVIHPPYVPAKESKLVFRDSGEDGEQIIRRTIQDLPRFLRPGGRFYSLFIATDRKDETLEQRMRKWLGPSDAEFDVVVGARSMQTPREFLAQLLWSGRLSLVEGPSVLDVWRATEAEIVVYAGVLIERHAEQRPPITRRLLTGRGFKGSHLDTRLDWEKAMNSEEHVRSLLDRKAALSADCELSVISRVTEGVLQAEEFIFESRSPFRSKCRTDAGLAQVLSSCDGSRTLRQLYEASRSAHLIPQAASDEEFAAVIGGFAGDGIVTLA